MNKAQRLACVVGLVVVLWQVAAVATPFARGRCGAALAEAFGEQPGAGLDASEVLKRYGADQKNPWSTRSGGSWSNSCRSPARDRLWRAGVLIVLAGVGTFVAKRILRDPDLSSD